MRQVGLCLSSYLDDGLFAAASKGQCFFLAKTLVLLFTSLGFFLSWDKCQLVPRQQGRFLGLLVDSATCQLIVPPDKVDYIQELIQTALQSSSVTKKQLATIAGVIMLIAPAVYMAPLYTRLLYRAMTGNSKWDKELADSQMAEPDLLYWLHHLDKVNGRSWLRSTEYIHVIGDASNVGYAAFTPNAELQSTMIVSFDLSEIDKMNVNQLSSVFRETKNVRLALETIINSLPAAQLASKVFVYTGDCAPAIQGLLRMKGSIEVFPEVKQLYLTAASAQLSLDFIWRPRTDAQLVHADELSRLEDSSEIFLASFVFDQICRLPLAGEQVWGLPTLDCFAGNERGQHQVEEFYSKYHCPKALGINALYQPWATDALRGGDNPLLWVFPPFDLVADVLNRVMLKRVDAILVLPKFNRFWQAMLKQLPCIAHYASKYHDRVYTIGSRAPKAMRDHKPVIPLVAYRICFSKM